MWPCMLGTHSEKGVPRERVVRSFGSASAALRPGALGFGQPWLNCVRGPLQGPFNVATCPPGNTRVSSIGFRRPSWPPSTLQLLVKAILFATSVPQRKTFTEAPGEGTNMSFYKMISQATSCAIYFLKKDMAFTHHLLLVDKEIISL